MGQIYQTHTQNRQGMMMVMMAVGATVVNLSVTVAPPSHHPVGTLTQR